MIAINTIRPEPHYRRAAFDAGLKRLGYHVGSKGKPTSKDDMLVLWNLHGNNEQMARDWEAKGGSVLVCENGYIGRDAAGQQLFAISVHGHNGSGWFPAGDGQRFAQLGIELQPFVDSGDYVLVCGQRGIGARRMASPPQWEDKVARQVQLLGHKVKIRRHPGRNTPTTTLEEDLLGAKLCIVWSSASGVKAMALGVPTVYCAPSWICAAGAGHGVEAVDKPVLDEHRRLLAMENMANGQWTVAEIEAGLPFVRILENLEFATW